VLLVYIEPVLALFVNVQLPESNKIIFCDDVNCYMRGVENLRDGCESNDLAPPSKSRHLNQFSQCFYWKQIDKRLSLKMKSAIRKPLQTTKCVLWVQNSFHYTNYTATRSFHTAKSPSRKQTLSYSRLFLFYVH